MTDGPAETPADSPTPADPPPVRKLPRGILCPTCAVKLEVLRTRRPTAGAVHRQRRCPCCGHTCRTVERPAA